MATGRTSRELWLWGSPPISSVECTKPFWLHNKARLPPISQARARGDALCQAAVETMRTHGFGGGITPFLGHGLGFAYHEDRPTLGPGENVIIQPGHVTSVEPGLYFFENGMATRRDASGRECRLGRESRRSGDSFRFPAGAVKGLSL